MDKATWEAAQPLIPGESKFSRAVRLKRGWEAFETQLQRSTLDQWAAFIPDLGPTEAGPLSDYQQRVNEAIESLTFEEVFEACQRAGVIAKTNKPVRSWSGDSNKFSCPNPAHPDNEPSAWGSREKGVWTCSPCSIGGDKFHLLGYLYGLSTRGSDFHQLCKRAAAEFRNVMGPAPAQPPTMPTPPVVVVVDEPTTPVGPSVPANGSTADCDEPEAGFPSYDLAAVLPGTNSFLDFYCGEALKSDIPREFPLWVGLSILSVAIGRRVALRMIDETTHANLALCLTGDSASGKGRSSRQGIKLLRNAIGYDDTPLTSGLEPIGARVVQLPGSGEALVAELDVTLAGVPNGPHFAPPALVEFEEMQTLLSKSAGPNSAYKDYVIKFWDCVDTIETNSLKNGRSRVENGFVTFLTGTQPQHLRDQFSKRDESRGFLNRFIFPFGKAVPRRYWDAPELNWMASNVTLRAIWNWSTDGPHVIEKSAWDDDASQLWRREGETRINADAMGPQSNLLGRMGEHMLRLILLFAANEQSLHIRLRHVKSAFALYDYIKACALNLAKEISATAMSDSMRLVLDTIIKAEEKLKRAPTRKLLNDTSAPVKRMNEEEFANTIDKLVRARQITIVKTSSSRPGGRKGTAYTTDPEQWAISSPVVVTPASGA